MCLCSTVNYNVVTFWWSLAYMYGDDYTFVSSRLNVKPCTHQEALLLVMYLTNYKHYIHTVFCLAGAIYSFEFKLHARDIQDMVASCVLSAALVVVAIIVLSLPIETFHVSRNWIFKGWEFITQCKLSLIKCIVHFFSFSTQVMPVSPMLT